MYETRIKRGEMTMVKYHVSSSLNNFFFNKNKENKKNEKKDKNNVGKI